MDDNYFRQVFTQLQHVLRNLNEIVTRATIRSLGIRIQTNNITNLTRNTRSLPHNSTLPHLCRRVLRIHMRHLITINIRGTRMITMALVTTHRTRRAIHNNRRQHTLYHDRIITGIGIITGTTRQVNTPTMTKNFATLPKRQRLR